MSLLVLISLVIALFFWLKRIFNERIVAMEKVSKAIEDEYGRLSGESEKMKQENLKLRDALEQTIAIYDTAKQICKSLEADKIFESFKEEARKYLKFDDCKFIKADADISQYGAYSILPLMLDNVPVGYLLTKGITDQDRDKLDILAQQLFLGLRRAFLYQKIQELTIADSLTGALSRRYYLERMEQELKRSKEFKYNFSCLMLDIDHFKGYNDQYGHLVGDAILKEVAAAIMNDIRQIDLFGRYGGEEFSIVLTETNKEGALLAAERIRQDIEKKNIKVYDEDLKVTVSIGIATFPQDASETKLLIDKSDQALYEAKKAGRNRVCHYAHK